MKKSELRKLIRELIKEQIHSAAAQHSSTGILPLSFTNRMNNSGCGVLQYALGKIDKKIMGINLTPPQYQIAQTMDSAYTNFPQQLPDFAGGVNPRWYALLQAKRHYINNLLTTNC